MPGVIAGVWLGDGNLLLPATDADHHIVAGEAVGFDEKVVVGGDEVELIAEGVEAGRGGEIGGGGGICGRYW